MLAVLAVFASLFNAPLLSLMIIHPVLMLRQLEFKRWALLAVVNVALGVLVFLLANFLIHGGEILSFYRGYARGYTSIGNLLDIGSVATVIVDFFLFSVLSPTGQLPKTLGWQDLSGY